MVKVAPVVYLLHGEDVFGISQFVAILKDKVGQSGSTDMNITAMDGAKSSLKQIEALAYAMPFLSDRRLIIIKNISKAHKEKMARVQALALLENLPATTAMVLIETSSLKSSNWLLKWAMKNKATAYIKAYPTLQGNALAAHLRDFAKKESGEITPQAASYLAELAGDNSTAATIELDKLLNYVDYKRPIEIDDVENLSPFEHSQADFFGLIDALGIANSRKAIDLLHGLLEEREPIQLFFSLVSNYRVLIQIREILDDGGSDAKVAEVLSMHPFRAKKLCIHARKLTLSSLESVYFLLHEFDVKIKLGLCQPLLALDLIVAKLTLPTIKAQY